MPAIVAGDCGMKKPRRKAGATNIVEGQYALRVRNGRCKCTSKFHNGSVKQFTYGLDRF
jgi:hypothetical protein